MPVTITNRYVDEPQGDYFLTVEDFDEVHVGVSKKGRDLAALMLDFTGMPSELNWHSLNALEALAAISKSEASIRVWRTADEFFFSAAVDGSDYAGEMNEDEFQLMRERLTKPIDGR